MIKTRDEHADYIGRNKIAIATRAWEGHQAEGRGCIFVDCDLHDPDTGLLPFSFLPEGMARLLIEDWHTSAERRMMTNYHPERQFVILFVRSLPNGGCYTDCYQIIPSPTPREAAKL
jgi:hypothetical protein